jgi:hypothetical protein
LAFPALGALLIVALAGFGAFVRLFVLFFAM